MFSFEKLDVWKKSIDLADIVYSVAGDFPSDERFGLTNQMRRAAVSISSNIAKGCSRSSQADFSRFVERAAGSVFEVVSQSFLAKRQEYLPENDRARIYAAAEEPSKMLSGLRRSLNSSE
jgi:four helix bundle protein